MLSRNQQIIRDYFNDIYKDLLDNPCILTSITIPDEPTCDIVNLIGTFNPEVKRRNITSMPVISINCLDENTVCTEYEALKEDYLKEVKLIIAKLIESSSVFYSLSLDYRLINDDILKSLKKKYSESRFTLRIIGENYVISPEVYEKLSFIDEIIVNDISENIVELTGSDLITNNYLVIDNIIPNKGYDPINEFYIAKDLSRKEYSLVIDKINNTISSTKKLFIRVYNPEKYSFIVDNILDFHLEDTVEINFLANPLEDKSEYFECLKRCPHKITITYTTNKERLNKLTKEPYSDYAHYIEELECNGKVGLIDYLNILYSLDFLQKKSTILDLSPLEKLIYVYRYIEKNSLFLKKNEINKERTYFNKFSYAKLFSIFLRRIGVSCFVYTTNTRLKNISYIEDKKYKIERILVTDITGDIDTKRYEQYNIYSFSYFGLSPIDTLKNKIAEYITIPASLVLSESSYNEYNNLSFNTLVRNHNLTKNTYEFAIRFLNLIGFNNLNKYTLKEDYYAFMADLLSKNLMEPIEESILRSAVSCIVDKELNDSRKKQKAFEIDNAVSSNRIGRSEFNSKPHILLNQNIEKAQIVEVSLIESKNKDKEFNNQKALFTNNAEKIIKDIFKIKKDSISYLQNNDYLIEAMNNNLTELYNDKVDYPLIVSSNRKRILKTLYNKYEKSLYKEIPLELYNYLRDEIIPEIEYISNSKELNYLLSCTEDDYNNEEYNRNYLRITTKIKYFIDKLVSVSSKEYGLSYEYSDYNLTIKVDNPHINDCSIQLVSADIVALSKIKVKSRISLANIKHFDNKKVQDYINVYLDKLRKYNEYIAESNSIITEIENLKDIINSYSTINEFIELEKKLIKQEEQIFKYKIELSNFRNTFYNKFETNITNFTEVKNFVLDNYSYHKKHNSYLELFTQAEQKILKIADYNNVENNQEIKDLLAFIDYINSYLNRRIISENSKDEDLSNKINDLYQRKSAILKKLSDIDNASKGLNIILKNRKINNKKEIIRIAIFEIKVMNLDSINYRKLVKGFKLKMSNQILNRFKSSKKQLIS